MFPLHKLINLHNYDIYIIIIITTIIIIWNYLNTVTFQCYIDFQKAVCFSYITKLTYIIMIFTLSLLLFLLYSSYIIIMLLLLLLLLLFKIT